MANLFSLLAKKRVLNSHRKIWSVLLIAWEQVLGELLEKKDNKKMKKKEEKRWKGRPLLERAKTASKRGLSVVYLSMHHVLNNQERSFNRNSHLVPAQQQKTNRHETGSAVWRSSSMTSSDRRHCKSAPQPKQTKEDWSTWSSEEVEVARATPSTNQSGKKRSLSSIVCSQTSLQWKRKSTRWVLDISNNNHPLHSASTYHSIINQPLNS